MSNRTKHPPGELVHGYQVNKHPLYYVWASMLGRCTNGNSPHYQNYGARGITVCADWHHFKNFARDMWPRPSDKHTLDRIDNEGPYTKDNCRWVERHEQIRNQRMRSDNTSGVRGVVKCKKGWVAYFYYQYRRYHVGTFKSIDAAAEARRAFSSDFFASIDAKVAQ